ncbi:D-CLADE TYPE 2C PROTEIN PHOSPHATASE 3 [Hibiscus trionum]|uniref:protein-serine/threonine phosphatase n=1 Tax=Hibiscus trionum TaxID=183268 RepID=A0A9W7IW50_HIBTR|nr:D-CLADE TYPE 2C PROTEIN PHOSPHATASE 3 [Hibiscus trionum]
MVKSCWKPSVECDSRGCLDGLLWYKDLGQHVYGDFSMAVIQANGLLEDQSQLESGSLSSSPSGPYGTFVGVYDGHGGPQASSFINDNLFCNFKSFVSENRDMSINDLRKAFLATEDKFLSLVRKQWFVKPQMASVGSCCLTGVICNGLLYIANAGDSRVVLGRSVRGSKEVMAMQLSTEHNASSDAIRDELRSMHPDDPQIVVMKHKVWRVKGIIQISRSIGDAYLKKAEFNKEPLLPKFRLSESFQKPILSAEPSLLVHELRPDDQFLVFASDGLWEHLSNQEVVKIVQTSPRNGIARRLVKAALKEAAKKREMRYSDLNKIDRGVRRHFHDDITVIVVFLDSHSINGNSYYDSPVSIKGGGRLATAAAGVD